MKPVQDIDLRPLLLDLKLGSEEAFSKIYKLYSRLLLINIQGLVKDQEVAKELLQDLFLRIWEHRDNIDLDKPFRSYLFVLARNLVFDYLRRVAVDKKARVRLVQNMMEFYSHTEEELEYQQSAELLQKAIELLPAQCRQVFTLSRIEGKTHQQIGELLGISIKTVNNHMVKANKEVRAYLLQHGDKAVLFFVIAALSSI